MSFKYSRQSVSQGVCRLRRREAKVEKTLLFRASRNSIEHQVLNSFRATCFGMNPPVIEPNNRLGTRADTGGGPTDGYVWYSMSIRMLLYPCVLLYMYDNTVKSCADPKRATYKPNPIVVREDINLHTRWVSGADVAYRLAIPQVTLNFLFLSEFSPTLITS